MKNKKIYISALLYSLVIGLSFLSTKIVLKSSTVIETLAHRFTISFIVIQIIIFFKKIKISFNKKDLIKILPLSIFYPILFFFFQAYGLKYISSSEGGVLFALTPVITLVIARIFIKEKTNFIQTLGVILSVLGVTYIFLMKGISFKNSSTLGIVLIMISVISSAIYSVIARKILQKYNFLNITYLVILVGVITFNLAYIIINLNNLSLTTYIINFKSLKYLINIAYLGIMASVMSLIFSSYSLSKMPASQFSVFSNFATLISIIAGILILKEKFYLYHILGTILIMTGVILTNFGDVLFAKFIQRQPNNSQIK